MDTTPDCISNRYDVRELLGRGGMGAVYRVFDRQTNREVALKRCFSAAKGDTSLAVSFEREYRTLVELAHPRIIEVYEYGLDEDGAYYTMELLGGEDARSLGKVPWHRACELLRDVASSLALLHARRLVHCDVSARNVRCTQDGRAKLLDFGAMMPTGVAKRVVGTPPFIAPEMMNQQTLDARTDLYAVGSLAYLLLTGRHAYPAHEPHELRDLWRRPVNAPATLEPSIPQQLNELVLELLQLNRDARPPSAAVVMERLCSIASLPPEDTADITHGYLSTPTLVGREAAMQAVRERLVALLRSEGSVIALVGSGGSGRSRILDMCVLEAKLLGMQVVRLDRSDAEGGNYAAAKQLCRQLFELSPQVAANAARLHAPILAHLLGSDLLNAPVSASAPSPRQLLMSLRDFVLNVVRSLRCLIAVDDAETLDDASLSLLAACAQRSARRSLCVLFAFDPEAERSTALNVLSDAARQVPLRPLTVEETEALLESVFGRTDHLTTIAHRAHAIARGNPRATMQLATHLVERGFARYEAGSFTLPEQLPENALPPSLASALEQRLIGLDADALELARALALSEPYELPTAKYVELTSHGDHARTSRAIDQLVRIQLLEPQGERYRLTDPTWTSAIGATLTREQRIELNTRLARVFEDVGSLARRSHHLLESEQYEPAIRLLLTQYLKDPNEPRDPLADYVPGLLDQLERAAHAAEMLHLPAPWIIELWMKVSGASQFLGDARRFTRVAVPLLERLLIESGLAEYNALDATLEPMQRLTTALTTVQQRFEATPEAEQGLPPIAAIRELARLCIMFTGIAAVTQDIAMIDRVPSLEPFVPLSPAVGAIHTMIQALRTVMEGRDQLGRELLKEVMTRLEQPDGAGLGELYRKSMYLGSVYSLGLSEAGEGIQAAASRVALLEREPGHRVNAQRVQFVYHVMQGDIAAALAANRRAELLMLQDGEQQRYPGTTLRSELQAYWLCCDIPGLKQVSERAAAMAERHPAWISLRQVARSFYKHAQGDYAGALAALDPIVTTVQPLRSRDWAVTQVARIQALVGLERAAEAVDVGQAAMDVCSTYGISAYTRIAQATAEALLAADRPDEACKLADDLVSRAEQSDVRGLVLGSACELRARVAIALDDSEAFERFSTRCAAEYHPERNPALAIRYQRLYRAYARKKLGDVPHGAGIPADAGLNSALQTVRSRLYECTTPTARASCALSLLFEQTGAERGFLYVVRAGSLELVRALPDQPPPADLEAKLQRRLTREIEVNEGESASIASIPSDTGGEYQTVLLGSRSDGQLVIAGIAALQLTDASRLPDAALVECVASALLEHDDVDPATCAL
jgi:Protein kinase domain/AAA ATPase domain